MRPRWPRLPSPEDLLRQADALHEAITLYRHALKLVPRDQVPLEWATMQNNLGSALTTLGERETGTAHLQ